MKLLLLVERKWTENCFKKKGKNHEWSDDLWYRYLFEWFHDTVNHCHVQQMQNFMEIEWKIHEINGKLSRLSQKIIGNVRRKWKVKSSWNGVWTSQERIFPFGKFFTGFSTGNFVFLPTVTQHSIINRKLSRSREFLHGACSFRDVNALKKKIKWTTKFDQFKVICG